VAFKQKDGDGDWIYAKINKVLGPDQYEVLDLDETEDGVAAARYVTDSKSIVPLPEPGQKQHVDYPVGRVVMGLYPDTSCFYKATVVSRPRDPVPGTRTVPSNKVAPTYKLRFEDDDDQVRSVPAELVFQYPGDSG